METYDLNVGEDKRRGISWHAHSHSLVSGVVSINQPTKQCFAAIAQVKSGVQTLASLSTAKPLMRSACDWVRLTGKQSTMKDSGIDRVTYVL